MICDSSHEKGLSRSGQTVGIVQANRVETSRLGYNRFSQSKSELDKIPKKKKKRFNGLLKRPLFHVTGQI